MIINIVPMGTLAEPPKLVGCTRSHLFITIKRKKGLPCGKPSFLL